MTCALPLCTSTARVDVLGEVRCNKGPGHLGRHRWSIEWQDMGGHIDAVADRHPAVSEGGT